MNDEKIKLIDTIVKGGVSVILSIGLLAILGAHVYIQFEQIKVMARQTAALEEIARTYAGR